MNEPRKILVPTDFSESSDTALRKAIDVAKQYNSKIYVLHVINQAGRQCAVDYCLPVKLIEQLEKQSAKRSRAKMKKEVAKLAGTQAIEIKYDIKTGVLFDEILKEQDERGIDLIVMASHARTGISKSIIKSVACKVAEKATVPVILVNSSP